MQDWERSAVRTQQSPKVLHYWMTSDKGMPEDLSLQRLPTRRKNHSSAQFVPSLLYTNSIYLATELYQFTKWERSTTLHELK